MGNFVEKNYSIGMCVPWQPSEEVYSAGKWKIGINLHSQVLEDHDASRKKSGRNIQKCELQERVP